MLVLLRRLPWLILLAGICYGTYLLGIISYGYTNFDPHYDFLETKQFIYHLKHWRWSFYLHVFSSTFILFTGMFQFSSSILSKLPLLHRVLGFTYLILLLCISGPAALLMSLYANGGIVAQISFTSLSLLWMSFTWLAYFYVRKKNYVKHGKWLLRSYALTLSAITLRVYSLLFGYVHPDISPQTTYVILSIISWVPNLLLAEWLIHRKFIERLFDRVQTLKSL